VVERHTGPATVESYTVMYGGEAPRIGYLSALLDDGSRTWATTEDQDVLVTMISEEFCGRPVTLADKTASF
jgi:hypothetical protein